MPAKVDYQALSDFNVVGGDLSKAISADAYSWIVKLLITKRLGYGANRILDVGCGRGRQVAHLDNVVGLDADLPSLRFAKRLSDNDFVFAYANWLPFRESSFDFVIMSEVIEHLPDQRGAVKEVTRVLLPNGRFLIQTPNRRLTLGIFVHRRYGHVREFTLKELRAFLSDLGFEVMLRTASTIPYIPSGSRLYKLNFNRAFFSIWKSLDKIIRLKWDIIVLARKRGSEMFA